MARHDNEKELIKRAKDGDSGAFDSLVEKYWKEIHKLVCKQVGNLDNAEDITQETFLRAWENIEQHDTSKNFKAWLKQIAVNKSKDWLKRRRLPTVPIEQIEDTDDPHGEGVHVSTDVDEKNRDVFLLKMQVFFGLIKRLPIMHQTVWMYLKWKDLSNKQISEEMDKPENTIGTWIKRAKDGLEKIFLENEIGWIQTNGPYGGTITALHATSEGRIFAGTLEVGIFCSVDGGDTWVHASKGLGNRPPSIRAFTQKGNTLYAGTDDGIFYWINRNSSWQQLTCFQRDRGVPEIATIGDTLYIRRTRHENAFFSNDNCRSWTQINGSLTAWGGTRLLANNTTIFAQTQHHVFRLQVREKLWTKLAIKDPWTKTTVESDIAKFTVSDEIICAATVDGGLFRSTDMGDSWKSIKPQAMQRFDGELAALGHTIFYISSIDGRVFRSTDAGDSWTMFNSNLTDQNILSIATLSDKTLCVGTYNGIFRSTNGGESWAQVTPGITDTDSGDLVFFRNAIYTVTGDGIVKSEDGGYSWGMANNGLIANDGAKMAGLGGLLIWTGAKLTVSGGKLYAATCKSNTSKWNPGTSGIYCWAEDENSWLPIHRKMPFLNDRIDTIDQLAVSRKTFYVIAHKRLYRWRVGEDLWTDLGLRVWHGRGFAVSGGTVCVQRDDGEILRSLDEGDTWTEVSRLPKSNVKVEPKRDTPLYRFDPQTDNPLFMVDFRIT